MDIGICLFIPALWYPGAMLYYAMAFPQKPYHALVWYALPIYALLRSNPVMLESALLRITQKP